MLCCGDPKQPRTLNLAYAFDLTTGSPTLLPSTSADEFEPSIAAPAPRELMIR
jgi:hypothetical protein